MGFRMQELLSLAAQVGQRLKERHESVAVAESSSGGLLSAALLSVPGIHVMLRPHPSDERDVCERLMREHRSKRMTLHRAGDSLTLVRACDVLVTQYSTVILEAAMLGRPVITADFASNLGPARVVAAGIATPVRSLEELTTELQLLVHTAHEPRPEPSESQQAIRDDLLGPLDGRAGHRVAQLVSEALHRVPDVPHGPPAEGATAGAQKGSPEWRDRSVTA